MLRAYVVFNGNGTAAVDDLGEVAAYVDGAIQTGTIPFSFSRAAEKKPANYEWKLSLSAATHTIALKGKLTSGTGPYQIATGTKWVLQAEPVLTAELTDGESTLCVDDPTQCCDGDGDGSGSGIEEDPIEDIVCDDLPAQIRVCITAAAPDVTSCPSSGTVQVICDKAVDDSHYPAPIGSYPISYDGGTWSIQGWLQCQTDCYELSPTYGKTTLLFHGSWRCGEPGLFSVSFFPCIGMNQRVLTSQNSPLHVRTELYFGWLYLDIAPVGTDCGTPPTGVTRSVLMSTGVTERSTFATEITVAAGTLLVVPVGLGSSEGAVLTGVTFDGTPLNLDESKAVADALGSGINMYSAVYSLPVDTDTTGDLEFNFTDLGQIAFAP
jgi:hypothetical protein